MLPTLLWTKTPEDHVQCRVCAHHCVIPDGRFGVCRTRMNKNGRLLAMLSDAITSLQMDPIEKKPLYHFLPGTSVFSVGGAGCNFRCRFCQNSHISVLPESGSLTAQRVDAQTLLGLAQKHKARSIAFTYNEPTLSLELINETALRAPSFHLPIVLVSNGYMSSDFLEALKHSIHAINVDLKSFRDAFYRSYCGARLAPVLETLKALKKTRIWFEVTTLVIPGVNDSTEEITDIAHFIRDELGPDIPWHLSAFHGAHLMKDHRATRVEELERAWTIGKEAGLNYVYMGNVLHKLGANTYCPSCSAVVVTRSPWQITAPPDGKCPSCGFQLAGVWQ